MKRSILFILLIASVAVQGQQLISGEYFWNSDPGEGMASFFTTEDGAFDEIAENLLLSLIHI